MFIIGLQHNIFTEELKSAIVSGKSVIEIVNYDLGLLIIDFILIFSLFLGSRIYDIAATRRN